MLVLNAGSSSVKFRVVDVARTSDLAAGIVERIGEAHAAVSTGVRDEQNVMQCTSTSGPVADHDAALQHILAALDAAGLADNVTCVGHRVVHGGQSFIEPTLVDDEVVAGIRAQAALAPLHNPANLRGIEAARARLPGVPHVAVFDTAFHRTLPPRAYRYALPPSLYSDLGIRRYGFHGVSHSYVAGRAAQWIGQPLEACNFITAHLGNGASITAIESGRSVDTSMGLTPLEGLVMGTRSGDLDPAVTFYLLREAGIDADEVETMLNLESGLKGLCGDNDLREIMRRAEVGDASATLALDMYTYRLRKYIGAYTAILQRVDAVVFTGGVGENAAPVRARACDGLAHIGIVLDEERNFTGEAHEGVLAIHADVSVVAVLVIPSNEELEIARQALACAGERTSRQH